MHQFQKKGRNQEGRRILIMTIYTRHKTRRVNGMKIMHHFERKIESRKNQQVRHENARNLDHKGPNWKDRIIISPALVASSGFSICTAVANQNTDAHL